MAGYRGPKDWMKAIGEESETVEDTLQKGIDDEVLATAEVTEKVVNNSFNRVQIKEMCKISIDWLAGTAMPMIFEYKYPKILLAAWSLLTVTVVKPRDFSKIALGIPRGFGKTTIIKLFVLWCILFTEKKFILVVCSTLPHAQNFLADIEEMLNERNVIRAFGDWKNGMESNSKELKKFSFCGRPIVLAGIGAQGSLRGLNVHNDRPDIMVFDDIQTAECAKSDTESNALLTWMVGTAMKAKSPRGCLYIFAGNMYPGRNSILKKLKTSKTWIKFISGGILADGTSLWEDFRPIAELKDELDSDIDLGKPEVFFAEVMNDTDAGINTRVDMSLLKPWPYTPEVDFPQGKYIVIDPSPGAVGGDDVAIGAFEVYDTVPCLVEVIEENLSPGNCIRRALLMAIRRGIKVIAVEATAYQSTLLYWFGVIADENGLQGFHFVPVNTGIVSKNSRISTMLKSLQAGEELLHTDVRSKVISQISNWSPLKKYNVDGILDLLCYGPKVIELYAHLIATEQNPVDAEANEAHVDENAHMF